MFTKLLNTRVMVFEF